MRDSKVTPFQKMDFFSPRVIINTLFGVALFIVILINIFSFFQASKLAAANQLVIHTYRVIESLNESFLNLVKIESAASGFIITNNPNNLDDMDANKATMYQNFIATKELTKNNQSQQHKITFLEPMLDARMALIKKLIEPSLSKNVQIVLVNHGRELSNKISALMREMIAEELTLLEQRSLSSSDNLSRLNIILLTTSIVSALLFILGIIVLNSNVTRQQLFLQEKLRYENLLGNIIEGTRDIIVVLDLNYRFIIFNHSFEHAFKSLFGKRPRLGESIIDTLGHLPDEQKKIANLWRRALDGEEFNLVSAFGGTLATQTVYECNFNSIYDEYGALAGASAICRNIEHRIEDERFLKATNEKLEHAYNDLKRHHAEISLLNEMENSLQSCTTINETLIIISKYCQKLLPFTTGIIYLINSSRNYLEAAAEWNSPKVAEKIFSPHQCWGLRQGKNYIYTPDSTSVCCEHTHTQDSSSYICVPLLAQNDVIGLLHMVIIDSNHLSTDELTELYNKHELLFKNLAVQLALAIANIQLRETLKTRSIRDPLTNLYNRAYLNEFFDRDLHRSQRNNIPVSIVMMDIDYFKKLNDKYGHDAGDMMLRELGKLLKESIRASDIICRYGGEEFLLIFYDTDLDNGCERVEKIRNLISRMEVSLRGVILDKITASFGLAIFPKDGTTVEALITAADQALYQSKKNGRNQLTVYSN